MLNKIIQKGINYYKNQNIIEYTPQLLEEPTLKLEDISSAWKGHDLIIKDLINRFKLNMDRALEFGVEFGFSTVAFSNYFNHVTGVDIFIGDIHTHNKTDHFEETKKRLESFKNITLIKADYKDYILTDHKQYDFIHVDIVHTYEDTYACGLWAAQHSKCTVFHDTESFQEVRWAVYDIAKATGKKFYNYPKHYGLGIIV